MIIHDRFDNEIELTRDETDLLRLVKSLLENKNDDFRVAFVGEMLADYCQHCGRKTEHYCHCQNDN